MGAMFRHYPNAVFARSSCDRFLTPKNNAEMDIKMNQFIALMVCWVIFSQKSYSQGDSLETTLLCNDSIHYDIVLVTTFNPSDPNQLNALSIIRIVNSSILPPKNLCSTDAKTGSVLGNSANKVMHDLSFMSSGLSKIAVASLVSNCSNALEIWTSRGPKSGCRK